MCPDRQIISLYFDGELPSPWKEKLETHLESCSECRAVFTEYTRLGDNLRQFPADTVQAAQDRVWEKLAAAKPETGPAPEISPVIQRYRPARRIWSRSISLPLPAAAAAAVVIIVLCFALVGLRRGAGTAAQDSVAVANIGFDDQGMLPVNDMSGILNYLSSQDNGDFMVVNLPASKSFSRSGEPTLINAADYSRRKVSR